MTGKVDWYIHGLCTHLHATDNCYTLVLHTHIELIHTLRFSFPVKKQLDFLFFHLIC
jgi:hypothetical protein